MKLYCETVIVAVLIAAGQPCAAQSADGVVNSPLSPEESLQHFQLDPGLRIELVAAEPDVIDPVAIAFDDDGRLWVVEMRDYPDAPATGKPPQSCIKVLEDHDGDGRYEKEQTFADGLLFCNGLQPWRGGAIITLQGEVAYFRDTDGDGRADLRETWFAGFKAANSQLRANHPTLGLDNQVYVANGLRSGEVVAKSPPWSNSVAAVSISGMDFRFDPRGGRYEAVTGHGQFGLTFDDFGNRFVCSNRNPCVQVVLEDHYIRRNKHLALASAVHDVSPPAERSRLFPLSRAWTTSNIHASQFTAACGVTILRGDALSKKYDGNSFTCEPTGNLVHRDVLVPDGVIFSTRPSPTKREFLASPDEWFRPVNLANGPDGALYVVDMYRAVIEHPEFMPSELKNRPENEWGKDRGRIYRIVRADSPPATGRRLGLSEASNDELVSALKHGNAWRRQAAARLLIERNDPAVGDPLQLLVNDAESPQARIHALWLLEGLGRLTLPVVHRALQDVDPRVQSHAVRLAERWLTADPELRDRVLILADHDDIRLRFQVALSLGEIDGKRTGAEDESQVIRALASIAVRDAEDKWMRAAVGASLAQRAPAVLRVVLDQIAKPKAELPDGVKELVSEIARLVGASQDPSDIAAAINGLAPLLPPNPSSAQSPKDVLLWDTSFACVDGLGHGVSRRGHSLVKYQERFDQMERETLARTFAVAAEVAQDAQSDRERRRAAIQVLRHAEFDVVGNALVQLAAREPDTEIRLAAIESLARFDDPKIGVALLRDLTQQTPAVRRSLVTAMLARPDRTKRLLDEMAAGRIAPTELQPAQWQQLLSHRDAEVRQRAKGVQSETTSTDRQQVIDAYRSALSLAADPRRGKEVFTKNCAGCHWVGDVGVNVAPDISDSRLVRPEQYLVDILDPNRAIDNNYFSYTAVLIDGQVLTGIVDAETASSITLRQQEGKSFTLLREDIEKLQSNGVSLMPVGFEQTISVPQMADLISFLKNWRYLDEDVPVRQP